MIFCDVELATGVPPVSRREPPPAEALATMWQLHVRDLNDPGRSGMQYISTRGDAPELTFEQVMMTGLAQDGGLYVPKSIPRFSADQIAGFAGLQYEDLVFQIIQSFVDDLFSEDELNALIIKAYSGFRHTVRAPLVQLEPRHFLMELFHGPTLAFKDFAMQLLGQLMQALLDRNGNKITIVCATSGDTGSAAIEAFRGLANVDVIVLYPIGRVSDVQRKQMTTPVESNIHTFAIKGSFDDAQSHVKSMFNDDVFRRHIGLVGVNSINWARILAQIVYYFHAALSVGAPSKKVSFTVPTGNFGDIYAGYIAKKMGLPVDMLVIATNHNDILDRALKTGEYRKAGVLPSISPSMDIQVASNFERVLFEVMERNSSALSQMMDELCLLGGFTVPNKALSKLRYSFMSGCASEEETIATIAYVWQAAGKLICPHTAVGVKVANEVMHEHESVMVTLATASPAKFPDITKRITGVLPELPRSITKSLQGEERENVVENDLDSIKARVLEIIDC